jgi:hypothetical protein
MPPLQIVYEARQGGEGLTYRILISPHRKDYFVSETLVTESQPHPKTEEMFDRLLTREELAALRAAAQDARLTTLLPPPLDDQAGLLDGCGYELRISEDNTRVALGWYAGLPPQWEGLSPLVALLEKLRREGFEAWTKTR